jgi:hypothetical protein
MQRILLELLHDPYVLLVAADHPLAAVTSNPSVEDAATLPLISNRDRRSVLR